MCESLISCIVHYRVTMVVRNKVSAYFKAAQAESGKQWKDKIDVDIT